MVVTMNIRHLTVATLMVSLTAALASGCGVGEASVASDSDIEAGTPIPVETAIPSRADIHATYEATTTIASDADAPVVAKVGGEVVRLPRRHPGMLFGKGKIAELKDRLKANEVELVLSIGRAGLRQ